MNKFKILYYFLIGLIIFIIYVLFVNKKINYVVIGDSVANGTNSYNVIDYSYSDYIADFLRNKNKLLRYSNEFTDDNLTYSQLLSDLINNKEVIVNSKKVNLNHVLRESDLVTLSVGQKEINLSISDISNINFEIINIEEYKKLIKELKKYAKNKIIVTGFYNSRPYDLENKQLIDMKIKLLNKRLKQICDNEKVTFIDLFYEISGNTNYFPNPNSMNINIFGQKKIFEKIINSCKIYK